MKLAAFILSWLSVHGYEPAQRDAVFVNARVESGLKPGAVSRAGDIGLWQWRGPRKWALLAYEARAVPVIERALRLSGMPGERLRERARAIAQMEFMDAEWRAMPASLAFFAAPTREAAYRVFCTGFERRRGCR